MSEGLATIKGRLNRDYCFVIKHETEKMALDNFNHLAENGVGACFGKDRKLLGLFNKFLAGVVNEIFDNGVLTNFSIKDEQVDYINNKNFYTTMRQLGYDIIAEGDRNSIGQLHTIRSMRFESVAPDKKEIPMEQKQIKEPGIKHSPDGFVYYPPKFISHIVKMLSDGNVNNVFFTGPIGCGKSECGKYLGKVFAAIWNKQHNDTLETVPVFVVDGGRYLTKKALFGGQEIKIDPETKQSCTVFEHGVVPKAMLSGTKDGKEVGPGAILVIDELPACPPELMVNLNGLLGSVSPKRKITLDNGEEVVSHSQFKIICTGNTIGRGLDDMFNSDLTAQCDAQDASFLSRFRAFFPFDYNKDAEMSILSKGGLDEAAIDYVNSIVKKIRNLVSSHELTTNFSTRMIKNLVLNYKALGDLGTAFYYGILTSLPKTEKVKWNEIFFDTTSVDLIKEYES